jgi:hypothetical protein
MIEEQLQRDRDESIEKKRWETLQVCMYVCMYV